MIMITASITIIIMTSILKISQCVTQILVTITVIMEITMTRIKNNGNYKNVITRTIM